MTSGELHSLPFDGVLATIFQPGQTRTGEEPIPMMSIPRNDYAKGLKGPESPLPDRHRSQQALELAFSGEPCEI
ncbi:hypothetical protein G7K_6743-t1 [Saitoella complicata NRRL Y-17804]|uniref:Uncharacterized protein n=1 Tax=Saitoella complicata (strain BCRC 22490 / CBS 7301 / JCM 7358 / NBRC 10748 / NRRL Y-17804) TaxID=698492 RepID=A0A0E9NSM0_SAICN|nr:hypothetical protein G7K_6743-t1 [Saitoella complicata NRRL Y-17804]